MRLDYARQVTNDRLLNIRIVEPAQLRDASKQQNHHLDDGLPIRDNRLLILQVIDNLHPQALLLLNWHTRPMHLQQQLESRGCKKLRVLIV